MRISVALCTYNGSRYLQEQLDSINAQKRLPDEVIICDDASQDDTPRLLREFQQHAPFAVKLYFNEANLGYTKNFEQAVHYCCGDVIALCDQDDVWHPDKLCCIEAALNADAGAGLVFSDAAVVDQNAQPLGYSLWQCDGDAARKIELLQEGRAIEALLSKNIATGATLAFRARFCELVLPIPDGGPIIHDWWIALMIGAVSKIVAIDKPLISYRRHEAQQMGFRTDRARVLSSEYYLSFAQQLEKMALRLRSTPEPGNAQFQNNLRFIEDKAKHLRARQGLPAAKWQRIPRVLRELTSRRYHRYSNGWRSAVRDLLL